MKNLKITVFDSRFQRSIIAESDQIYVMISTNHSVSDNIPEIRIMHQLKMFISGTWDHKELMKCYTD